MKLSRSYPQTNSSDPLVVESQHLRSILQCILEKKIHQNLNLILGNRRVIAQKQFQAICQTTTSDISAVPGAVTRVATSGSAHSILSLACTWYKAGRPSVEGSDSDPASDDDPAPSFSDPLKIQAVRGSAKPRR
ncbi:hypothetical protein QAD02_024346 [Eretmocerus hayati]|uniref:Uncharacterized protein n=1 Tax=Eretmocerus hayati TaxID=131215 RepID=A0ACC2PYC9_9HYME|nr:hypothetical protein QAD02_024346 [Eretmocerus hayati]